MLLQEIDGELQKLGREQTEVALRARGLIKSELTIGAPNLRTEDARTTAGGRVSTEVQSMTLSSPVPSTPSVSPAENAVLNSPTPDFTVTAGSASLSSSTTTSSSSQASTSLNADLNNRVKEATRAKIQQRSASNQTEAPSVSTNSTSLVDTSSAGDPANLGLNLAGLTGASKDGATKADSVSVTTSAYALYSAFKAVDPLNPRFYNRNSGWRRLVVYLGIR